MNLQINQQDYDVMAESDEVILKKKIKQLLDEYERLKNKSTNLDKEIEILENVNMELKYKVFV